MPELSTALTAVILILLVVLVIRIFSKPIKWILKLLLNVGLGFVVLCLVNFFGSYIGISVSVGWISALVVAILGLPGVILLILLETFIM